MTQATNSPDQGGVAIYTTESARDKAIALNQQLPPRSRPRARSPRPGHEEQKRVRREARRNEARRATVQGPRAVAPFHVAPGHGAHERPAQPRHGAKQDLS